MVRRREFPPKGGIPCLQTKSRSLGDHSAASAFGFAVSLALPAFVVDFV
jgi:hypothetical protein